MDSFDICLIARLRFEVATFYLSKSIFDPFKIYIIQLNCNSYNTTLAEKCLVMIEHLKGCKRSFCLKKVSHLETRFGLQILFECPNVPKAHYNNS